MSGPVTTTDAAPTTGSDPAAPPCVEVLEGRRTEVGGIPVTRFLPKRARRTVGAWCFVDHFGPSEVADMQVGPHPHIGLQTVTWILEGEVLHRDSLGSEQPIRPGQLNLMSAGHGVAHAEETPRRGTGVQQGVQLWVAQPDATRDGPPAFEHHASLPRTEPGTGVVATVLVGELAGARSPARTDTPLVGAEVSVAGTATLPLEPAFEHALVVLDGSLRVDGRDVGPGVLAYLGEGRAELALDGHDATALLLGGAPMDEPILMWWNFVARTGAEIDEARQAWAAGDPRFGGVDSALGAIPAPARTGMPGAGR